ncbi:hypothetical protein DQ04_01971040 [Trypanosoma grayi]|uniref:hypothetical protein n=1 Tax=Trypanosoma grayi TaxID=71804 RepID=UPI0004F422C3|nr:hypothetical protein DQ04_01971040 [Trypanosoma grayi]KEG12132.1 hypothetical protein DQ04_01971040 [Trypanosoma grayi]
MTPKRQLATVSGGARSAVKKSESTAPPSPVLPLWRFLSLELVICLFCHLMCLGITFFAPGRTPLASRSGWLQQRYRNSPRKGVVRGPFDVFQNYEKAAPPAPMTHQINSDAVLTLLLVFTVNSCILALMRRIDDVMAAEEKKLQKASEKDTMAKNDAEECTTNVEGTWKVKCNELLNNVMLFGSAVLSVVTGICVIGQPANQVRALGPAAVLISLAIDLCVLHGHGKARALRHYLNLIQALVICVLVGLVAEANLYYKE